MRAKVSRAAWPDRWPLRWRITAASASLTLLILLVFGAAIGNLVADRLHEDFNRELNDAASSLVHRSRIVERIFESGVSSPELRQLSLPSDSAARLVSPDGVIIESTPTNGLEFGPVKIGIVNYGDIAVATLPVTGTAEQTAGYVQYARSTDSVEETITKLWIFIFGGVVGGTVLAFLAGLALASRAMRPVASLTATAREVASTQDPSHKLPAPTTSDEVGELTETLQRMLDALDAARRDREETLQRQREFVADASHELRTPLTSVLANLELLEAQLSVLKESEEHEIVTSAVRSSRRMSRLVADLLFLAKSDAGQRRERTRCNVNEVVESASREVKAKLREHELTLALCPEGLVCGNQDDLHRLVLNLLDNAIRYSPADARINVSTRCSPDAVVIEVSDSGPGIPSSMRHRVFERFVRSGGASSDTDATEGTGLGLAMVAAIAADHGGTVVADTSEELGGARMVVTLPSFDGRAGKPGIARDDHGNSGGPGEASGEGSSSRSHEGTAERRSTE